MARKLAWAVVASMAGQAVFGAAFAQAPTTAQRNAIRSSCRADYEATCADIPAGGQASLQCLSRNMASLSPACQSAVSAISGGGGAAPGTQGRYPQAPAAAPQAGTGRPADMCRADFAPFCGNLRPGGGRAIMCLRQNAASLSPGCQSALMSLRR